MIPTSTVMFGLTYLNTEALDHVAFSQTRAWMAIVMGAAMAIVMLGFCGACTATGDASGDRRRQRRNGLGGAATPERAQQR
jgi:hypothetical protein